MIQIEQMSSFPANANPFSYDAFHMGTKLGSNVVVMHPNFADGHMDYMIIVNVETGKRIKVRFQAESVHDKAAELMNSAMRFDTKE